MDDGLSSGGSYVQAGSFRDFDNAKKMAARLQTVGKARVRSREVGDRTFYRVMLGPFTSPSYAKSVVKRLKSMGIGTLNLVP